MHCIVLYVSIITMLRNICAQTTMYIQQTDSGVSVEVRCRIDTDVELTYYRNGGILNYMVRKLCRQ